jgi:hypothetical protein
MHEKSKKMALCGLLAALATVWLMLGGVIPLAAFCCPILAMLTMIPVVVEYRAGTAMAFYAAVSLLGLLLSPDKECALVFVFLGYYPVIREGLDRKLRRLPLRLAVKCGYFLISAAALYAVAIYVFGLGELAAEFKATAAAMLIVQLVLGVAVFLLCDRVLAKFTLVYQKRLRHKLFGLS